MQFTAIYDWIEGNFEHRSIGLCANSFRRARASEVLLIIKKRITVGKYNALKQGGGEGGYRVTKHHLSSGLCANASSAGTTLNTPTFPTLDAETNLILRFLQCVVLINQYGPRATHLMRRFLLLMGHTLVSVSNWEWARGKEAGKRKQYLMSKP